MLSTWPPQACGIGQYAFNLAEGYKANGAAVTVLAESDLSFSLAGGRSDDTTVVRGWQRDTWGVSDLAGQIDFTKPDILDVQHEFGIWTDSSKLALLLNRVISGQTRVVVTIHTATIGHPALRALGVHFVVHSALMRAAWGANSTILPHPTPDLHRSYEAPPDEVFASLGFISPGKRLDENLRVLARLARLDTYPWTYVIAGEEAGNLVSEDGDKINVPVRRYVSALGLNDRVKVITDYLDAKDRIDLMARSSLVILNHRGVSSPSISGAARDVLALGVPSVSSRSYMYDELPAAVSPKFSTEAELLDLLESRFWRDPNWIANAEPYFQAARRWGFKEAAEARLLL